MPTAKTAATRKAKGSRLEKKVAERYRHYKVDETAQRMPLSGAMAHFKGDISKRHDYDWIDECKNHETVKLGEFWDQTLEQTRGLRTPVLHVSGNYRPIITLIRQSDYHGLVGDDTRRFGEVDVTHLKRIDFWKYAEMCTEMTPRALVVHCLVRGELLTMMRCDVYMQLRKENL